VDLKRPTFVGDFGALGKYCTASFSPASTPRCSYITSAGAAAGELYTNQFVGSVRAHRCRVEAAGAARLCGPADHARLTELTMSAACAALGTPTMKLDMISNSYFPARSRVAL